MAAISGSVGEKNTNDEFSNDEVGLAVDASQNWTVALPLMVSEIKLAIAVPSGEKERKLTVLSDGSEKKWENSIQVGFDSMKTEFCMEKRMKVITANDNVMTI
jgi:hypothetical protein